EQVSTRPLRAEDDGLLLLPLSGRLECLAAPQSSCLPANSVYERMSQATSLPTECSRRAQSWKSFLMDCSAAHRTVANPKTLGALLDSVSRPSKMQAPLSQKKGLSQFSSKLSMTLTPVMDAPVVPKLVTSIPWSVVMAGPYKAL